MKINNILYFYLKHQKSASKGNKNNLEYYLSVIFAGIIFYDYYIDYHSEDIQIIINYINFLKWDFKKIKTLYPSLFLHFFGKILTNNKLSLQNKNDIMLNYNISENCDSYKYFKWSQTYTLNNSSNQNKNQLTLNTQIIELSIIIIFNNCENIIRLINSIISQNFIYFEVILIFDGKNQKDFNFISNYVRFYTYFTIFKHPTKKGVLYSISEGVQKAKGKYLLILNPNCFFIEDNAFQNIHKEIEMEEIEIIEFNLNKVLSNKYINLYKCRHFTSRFDLKQIKYDLNYNNIDINDELLTNKLFKSKFLQTLVENFNLNEIKEINDYYYNNIFTFIIESTHYTYKYIVSINLYINENNYDKYKFNDFSIKNADLINETIFFINFIFDNSDDSFLAKEKVLKEFFNYLSIIFNKFVDVTESSINLLNKFLDCKYISETDKISLKFYYYSLIN